MFAFPPKTVNISENVGSTFSTNRKTDIKAADDRKESEWALLTSVNNPPSSSRRVFLGF